MENKNTYLNSILNVNMYFKYTTDNYKNKFVSTVNINNYNLLNVYLSNFH